MLYVCAICDLFFKDSEQTINYFDYWIILYYFIISCNAGDTCHSTRKHISWETMLETRRKQTHKTFLSKTLSKTFLSKTLTDHTSRGSESLLSVNHTVTSITSSYCFYSTFISYPDTTLCQKKFHLNKHTLYK